MKHYSYDEWMAYVKDEISEGNREELENHLYTCDQCLENYLEAVSTNETSLPVLSNQSNFTDQVMAMVTPKAVPDTVKDLITMERVQSVPDTVRTLSTMETVRLVPDTINTINSKVSRKKRFYQQAVFHYLLAAAATIVLMFTGAFQSLATYAGNLESPRLVQEKKPSVTEGVINKTFAWMDSLEKKEADKK
ncbi:anti-sigma factor family protein [Neobacillus sp. NPDC097160]|uniref:anti-sigma factor family protein n=1 Tax=Neobacillus sp. NPDC097160 TaxID=3364298 RepID=UPI003801C355